MYYKKFIIPRIKPMLPIEEIILFLRNLYIIKSEGEKNKIIKDFETKYAKRYNYPPAVAVNKARMAFYYLLKNMRLKKGGEIIISAIHVADFTNMITLAGFKPIVVDLKENSYLIDYDDLEKKINENTALMLITHLSGYSTDMERIVRISQKYNVPFVEDCSQAVTSSYKECPVGTFGIAAFFSLSLLKPVSTLSGGVIISKNTKLLEIVRNDIKNSPSPHKIPLIVEAVKNIILKIIVNDYLFKYIFFPIIKMTLPIDDYFAKYQKTNKTVILRKKMPNEFLESFSWQQAVMGLSQLENLEERERKRIQNGLFLYKNIKNTKLINLPDKVEECENSFWLFPLIVDDITRFRRYLLKHGIDCSKMLLSCLSEEPEFRCYQFSADKAKNIKDKTLFIPNYVVLKQEQLEYIVSVINNYSNYK